MIDIDAIVTALKREYEAADDYYSSEIAPEQEVALKFYNAEEFGDEQQGLSQVVLPDVAEVIDYMTISLVRPHVAGDKIVEFEATVEDDEQAADEMSAAMTYNFMREQDGYSILVGFAQAGLIEKYGVIKTACETVEKVSRERGIVNELQARQFDEEGILEDAVDQGDGTYLVTIKRQSKEKRYYDLTLPSEEFRFSVNARHEDDADYLCHVSLKTRSELVEMGFDRDQVYSLPIAGTLDWNERDKVNQWRREESTAALQQVLLLEEYARMDIDDDGIAERIKVFRVDNEILIDAETGEPSIEQVDDQPFVVWTPFPKAHRMVGNSMADKTMDLQRIRSMVARQLNDGLRQANMPRPIVDMSQADDTTIQDLLRAIPGAPIRTKGLNSVVPYQTSFDVSKSLAVLEYWSGERETRTGITRLNQGLDADTLNKTATGAALISSKGEQVEDFLARNMGAAIGRLFAKKAKLMKAEGDQMNVRVDGKYHQINPSQWPEDFKVNLRVGLGTGRKDQRIQYRMALAPMLAEAKMTGMVDEKGLFRMFDGLVRDMGLGQGDDYWTDPDTKQQSQEPQPNPEMEKVQGQLQLQSQTMQAKLQLEQQKTAAQLDADRERHALEMDQKREQAALDAQLQREKNDAQIGLARERAAMEAMLAVDTPDYRPGGDLDK